MVSPPMTKTEAHHLIHEMRQSVERAEAALRDDDAESLRGEMQECISVATQIEESMARLVRGLG